MPEKIERLVSDEKIKPKIFCEIGKMLRVVHDENIIHGDFSPINVVFAKERKIYFIDAFFSHHNTEGKVLLDAENIYHDISLFCSHKDLQAALQTMDFFSIQ